MAGGRMLRPRKGPGRPGPAPGPAVALLPPPHRPGHVRPGPAGHRAARPALPDSDPPASTAGQPAAWRDTGKLPASADDQPPGDDPGLVKVSVPEARRLARLATAPMSGAARNLGHAWSRWRRRHQARARWHHYHARLKAVHVT